MNEVEYLGMRTDSWPRYKIGHGEPVSEYLGRVRAELAHLENASRIQYTGRRVWGTHSYPGGCWVCDTFGLVHGLLGLLEEAYPIEETEEDKETPIYAKSAVNDHDQTALDTK